jgi:WhiB family transcriptional regulator, redox-sensing transcriptional regulator
MIKRTNRSRNDRDSNDRGSAVGAIDTNEFGRPIELCAVEADPDSPTAWMSEGNCRLYPPAAFFPSDGVGVDRARKICKDCPVASRCLDYALEERIEHGVWGGCSERERRRILKRRRDDAARAGTDTGQLIAIV